MSPSRRDFLKTSALVSGALGVGVLPSAFDLRSVEKAPAPLRILILGGTGFIGPNQVRYAVARGHHVTLFNRGKTNPGLFKGVPNIDERIGDRAPKPGNYDSLKDGEWDVVIDNPTTRPRWVREAAAAVQGRAKQYIFISTISVYDKNDTPGADESAAVATTDTPDVEDGPTFGGLYGPLKALSEKEAEKAFPGHATIIRPGLIVGVGDPSDRYTYWPVRVERGGEVLAPPAEHLLQFIDARDLGEWSVRCAENKTYGVFNATGPKQPYVFGPMLAEIKKTVKSDATFTHVTPEFLRANQIRGWTGPNSLAAWINPVGPSAGFMQRSVAKAVAAGLTYRPHADTIRETLDFYHHETPERQAVLKSGLTPEKEKELLAAWHAANG
ncbi:MAG TPA: twin-arginine translocation signal domain-containing protein [Gemmatimonadaceae bacterium]|nr:twin-arginine translocation signal domain-containing protein [Gemmatimonadaceae bacterium]